MVATLEDYAAVRELVVEVIAEGIEATVPPAVRETVSTVERLLADGRKSGCGRRPTPSP